MLESGDATSGDGGRPCPTYFTHGVSMNVLLVRPDGIGDEILCLPIATALRELMPQARVIFLSSEYAAPLLQHHPDLDEVWTVTGRESRRELLSLFRRNVDTAIFLKPFRNLMWAAFLARVPIRVATGYRWYSLLANRRVYEHRKDFSKHETEYNVGMLKGLGLRPSKVVSPQLIVTRKEREAANDRLKEARTPRVVLHPGGFAARRWRIEHYRELAESLQRSGMSVVLTGSQAEAEQFSREVLATAPLPDGVLNLMGALSVRELMAVIAESHAVVSGATGPAHIAAACGVPNVSLFDPRRNNLPTRWRPLGKGVVLRPEVPTCEKCIYEACPYWDCLDRLTVETVSRHVKQVSADHSPIRVVHV
jgi:ADP-heptose:LPS heptosyltransferase